MIRQMLVGAIIGLLVFGVYLAFGDAVAEHFSFIILLIAVALIVWRAFVLKRGTSKSADKGNGLNAGAGNKPYRKLIEYHIKGQSAAQLQAAVLGETSLLPDHLRAFIEAYIDSINLRFGYDKQFWETATRKDAFLAILEAATELLPLDGRLASVEDALLAENRELAFQLFQIATLSFAYSASLERKQRKFMGIRKNIFG